MSEMTKETLEELRELEQEATPGEWSSWYDGKKTYIGTPIDDEPMTDSDLLIIAEMEDATEFNAENDFNFIAAARNALPSLLTHITTLESQVAELTGLLTRSEPILVRFATSNPKHEYDGKMQDPYGVHTILEELKAARAKGGT